MVAKSGIDDLLKIYFNMIQWFLKYHKLFLLFTHNFSSGGQQPFLSKMTIQICQQWEHNYAGILDETLTNDINTVDDTNSIKFTHNK